jgi:hypothetical protein
MWRTDTSCQNYLSAIMRVVGLRRTGGRGKLALSHSTIYSITATPDLILRLAQHRQKADYFVDAAKAFVIKAVNAHKITNLVTMLSHNKRNNIR